MTTRLAATLAALLCLVTALTACEAGSGRPQVVVTTNILGDITQQIVGDTAEVTVLMKPNADPHSFAVSAPQAAELEQADLIVYNGLGLEENVLRHVANADDSGVPAFEVGRAVDPMSYADDTPDPHFWTDPDRARTAAKRIAAQVSEHVDGIDTSAVKRNADAYDNDLAKLTSHMERSFKRIPKNRRSLVTNHHVFGYLADRFGFDVIGAVIPSGTTLASPSSSDLESLVRAMRKAHVRTIFADSSQPNRLAKVLRDEVGGRVAVVELYSESLTAKGEGAATYLDMMRANTDAIADGLSGKP